MVSDVSTAVWISASTDLLEGACAQCLMQKTLASCACLVVLQCACLTWSGCAN